MAASILDKELMRCWSLLFPVQKKSLLELIRTFLQPEESDQQFQEAEALYNIDHLNFPKPILKQLSHQQKEALIALVRSFGIEDGPVTIGQYNKEINDAEAAFERGEVFTHEEVIAMSKKWLRGS